MTHRAATIWTGTNREDGVRLRDFGTEGGLAHTVWHWLVATLRRPSPINILFTLLAGFVLLAIVLASVMDPLAAMFGG